MDQLGIFAKYWEPGRVKTRLAATLGDAAASQVHRAFLECLLARFRDLADHRVLAFSPPDRAAEFAALAGSDFVCQPQSAGDLGARIEHFFRTALVHESSSRVVLLGSDSPNLPREIVEQAFELLTNFPLVLGPAVDGGYYLIGLRGEIPPIFHGMPWSTGQLWQATTDRLQTAGIRWASLPEWYDVDDGGDLNQLLADLRVSADSPALAQLRDRLESIS